MKKAIITRLQALTGHDNIKLTMRGDAAIEAVFSCVPSGRCVLVPAEGGWSSYQKIPLKKKMEVHEVGCMQATIDLADLQQKLETYQPYLLLYQNPGGYFAEQPMEEIYQLCQKYDCFVVIDVSGALGTKQCDGGFADVMLGSFGKWKLVDAGKGGFLSCRDQAECTQIVVPELSDTEVLHRIMTKLEQLPERLVFLREKRDYIRRDLMDFLPLKPQDDGFVVIIPYTLQEKKTGILTYCEQHNLPWTECPRYIRVLQPAISIEVKRLSKAEEIPRQGGKSVSEVL